jgi:hypothetical protein
LTRRYGRCFIGRRVAIIVARFAAEAMRLEPAADSRFWTASRRSGRGEGMSVDTDNNFITLASGLVVNIAYWDRVIDAEYEIWLRRNTIDEWVANGD